MIVRVASESDSEDIRRVERSAGVRFREIGMDWVASHEPMSASLLKEFARSGRSWVVDGADGHPVGYVVIEVVDGCAHIEQLSVDLEHQSRGIGRALIEEVESWAVANGLGALTLTTFSEVPWNRPLYEHLGFNVLSDDELSPGLRKIRYDEAKIGLDPEIRVCMRRTIGPAAETTPGKAIK